ncbi:MAG: hypothetical protein AAF430_12720 [Myxococcota bacterium]
MGRLDAPKIRTLLSWVVDTREDELDCDGCLRGLAEFAETKLLGAAIPEALVRIETHLSQCPECAEEYALLRDLLRDVAAPLP